MEDNFKIDFAGIGVPKAATTWIYECLQEHPEICMAKEKEAHIATRKRKKEKLKKLFSYCKNGQKRGEFSPLYLYQEQAPEKIKELNPEIKLIACLRNPIERDYSRYLQDSSLVTDEWESFGEAIERSPFIIERGFYAKYLKNFYDLFPKEQIKIMIYEDIQKNPKEFIQEIYDFIEVNSTFVPTQLKRKVSPTAFKLTKLGKLVHKLFGQPLGKFEIGRKIKRLPLVRKSYLKFAEFYALKKGKKPEMNKKIRGKLKKIYQQDIYNLEKLIGKDLSHWK